MSIEAHEGRSLGIEASAVGLAARDAARWAAQAGVAVRELRELDEAHAVIALLVEIWGRPENPLITVEFLRALTKAGNYVAGAYDGDRLIGVCIGFHEEPAARTLHSHIAGVAPGLAGRGIGMALKLHQRAWALARGIVAVEWTFDPLVSRNAYFNIVKLGALPVEYLPNFYGAMHDAINGGDDTDRLLVRWELLSPRVRAACSGTPCERPAGGPSSRRVAAPADIEALRVHDAAAARGWRHRLRDELEPLMAAGGRVVDFDREHGYLVRPDLPDTDQIRRTP
ncbi:putative GNAT superfamily acetyltransferase [Nonomuraea thailandensis]|uniref:GNAT superfamily acetyltransferase n=1 Tax=Nonomuraea thailandensis TaxID=1188745 RepID=A0A9X2GGD0_9ACTN|nr:GNAT family N-acetyltransferase [Nonomuraea thailandensis]MCP2356989.1 putative GNAT superfamily acetyltransferase [Nonomuraea thailandensis]